MRTVGEINDDWIARLSVPGSDPPMCSICRFKIETYVGADHSGCLEAVRIARLSPLPDNSLPDCAICHKIIDDRHLKTEVEMGDGAKRLAHETCYKIFNGIPNSTPDDSHYHKGRTDPWGYIIANELNFFEGNVVKYVTRWRHKNGLDDLRKARVYIDELIRQEEAK